MLNLSANPTYHYRVRSTDNFGNTSVSGDFTVTTTTAPTCPCTIWLSSAAPTTPLGNDGQAIALGVKFTAEHDGFINGIRFYKASGNTGTHSGQLWQTDGTLMANATFTGESASGWQQVNFSSPVAITAGTTYVASYLSAAGNYSATAGTFATSGVDRSPLHALSNAAANGNGVYLYTASPQMPTQTFNAANYWVDVVYTLTGTGASTPSTLASTAGSSDEPVVDGSQPSAAPATKGAALNLIALGLVKPHGSEHEVSFWCPLGTTDPQSAAVAWNVPPSTAATASDSALVGGDSSSVPWTLPAALPLAGLLLLLKKKFQKISIPRTSALQPRPAGPLREAHAT